jgi:Secretion system C-terminal sorting domain
MITTPGKWMETNISRKGLLNAVSVLLYVSGFAQYNVTEIITDYKGYWKTGASAISNVKPDNSHNLVSFSFNGNRYSTGVNDALLTTHGQSFIAGDYRSLPVTAISGAANGNTKIGFGYMADGVANGPGAVSPSNSMPQYLTDGIKGLDLGTCVANLPSGTLFFPVSKILTNSINDGVPDIVITQIADPSNSMDRYEFTDINGKRVGNYVDIKLDNIAPVGNWTADFYDANKNPMTLSGGFTKTDRPMRLWASDLHSFGINATNAASIAYFKINLSGNSDVAFVAYNNNAINLTLTLLPVTLSSFTGRLANDQASLQWETANELHTASFSVERSNDGNSFTAVSSIKAAGNTTNASRYTYTDKFPAAGNYYYRLKIIDKDGYCSYSAVVIIHGSLTASNSIQCYPNPASTAVTIRHPYAGNDELLTLINMQGMLIKKQRPAAASFQTTIQLNNMAPGTYQLLWKKGQASSSQQLIIQ